MSIREEAKNGLMIMGVPMKSFTEDRSAEIGLLVEIAIGLTILFVVIGYVLAPVGLTAFGGVNRTAAGVAAGTTAGNIWDALLPVSIAVLILALVMVIKKVGK